MMFYLLMTIKWREKIKRKFKNKFNRLSDLSNYLMNLYNHPRLQKLIV